MAPELSGQVAVITGATGNVGRAVAARFQQAGARLALVGRSADSLQRAYPFQPDQLLVPDIDLSSPEQADRMSQIVLEQLGRLDILVNAVGGYLGPATVEATDPPAWDRVMDLNARSTFLACRSVIPAMRAQGRGKIVNVAARTALRGLASAALYSAAKAAVLRMTESLSDEVKQDGINVNCVLPGTLDTPQNRQGRPEVDTSGWVQLEALADVILFLASDAARAIHGVGLPVYNLT
jgi:NAD(P)-dependent dehydrogenase (short-subunit alcohol dehydrogenase family)